MFDSNTRTKWIILTYMSNKHVISVQNTWPYLTEHTSTTGGTGWFVWWSIYTHGFPVTWELKREFLLPHLLDYMVGSNTHLTFVKSRLVGVVIVDFLNKHRESSFSGFTNLLIDALSLKYMQCIKCKMWLNYIGNLHNSFTRVVIKPMSRKSTCPKYWTSKFLLNLINFLIIVYSGWQ